MLESIDGYLKQTNQTPTLTNIVRHHRTYSRRKKHKHAEHTGTDGHSTPPNTDDTDQEGAPQSTVSGKHSVGRVKSGIANKKLLAKYQALKSKRAKRSGVTAGVYSTPMSSESELTTRSTGAAEEGFTFTRDRTDYNTEYNKPLNRNRSQ